MHTSRRFLAAAAISATALFFAGCQTSLEPQSVVSSPDYWQSMQQKLAALSHFSLSGRLGMTGSTRFSSNFTLNAEGDSYTLELTSSFGNRLALLTVKPGKAILTADGKTYTATDAQSLFFDTFKLELPLSSLKGLVLGLIGPASLLRPDGQLLSTAQDGFVVNYEEFQSFNGYALPTRMTALKDRMVLKIQVNEVASIG